MIVIIFNNSCGPFLSAVSEMHRSVLLSVVWFLEELYAQNEGNFHKVLLEGKFCRFDSLGIHRDVICSEKNTIDSLLSRLLRNPYYYLLFSLKIVLQTFISTEYYIYYLSIL